MNKLKILFTLSLLGVFLLLIIQQNISPKNIISSDNYTNLSKSQISKSIQLTGNIEKIYYNQNSITLYLFNYPYKIILFSSSPKLQKNQKIELIGTIELYRNDFEIIADKIYLLNS